MNSLGPWVCSWIEKYLVHAEGDYLGQPFRLAGWQKDFICKAYALDEDGRRKYDRALLGLPKGNGKTELGAALGLAELAGPVSFAGWNGDGPDYTMRTSPDIPIAAASFDQADTLFGAASTMVKQGPLADYFAVYETELYPKDRVGSLYRVAAAAGTNDGKRPTFFLADEVHEWEGRKERVHLVLSNGRAKRQDAWELSISTAGWDPESLLHRLYDVGKSGEDDRFLFVWYEADPDLDLSDKAQRREAIIGANPAAGDFLSIDNIEARFHEIPEHEWRRYYLNQWTSVPEQWIDADTWDGMADTNRVVPPAEIVTLGFDGSYNQDSTALIGCTVEDPHLFTIGVWERPEGVKEWVVDQSAVEDAILSACGDYSVKWLAADDTFGRIWSKLLLSLEEKGVPVVEWPTRSPSRMSPACGQFWGAAKRNGITHDGDPQLTSHILNARTKTDRYGPRIVKEYRGSPRHIDAAVGAVIAYDMVVRSAGTRALPWLLSE